MKLYTFCILSLLIFFISCKKENVIEYVEYNPISFATPSISLTGPDAITVHDTITGINKEKIIEAGFIFYNLEETPVVIPLKNVPEKGEAISLIYHPKEAFLPFVRYTFYAYVKTNKGFYKGLTKDFYVDPILFAENITKTLALGETLTIEGDFRFLDDQYYIRTDKNREKVTYILNPEKNRLSITFTDNSIQHGQELVYMINKDNDTGEPIYRKHLATISAIAVIDEPTKYNYDFFEQIVLNGSSLPFNWAKDLKINIGENNFIYNGSFSFAELTQLINLKEQKISWGYTNGRDQVEFKKPLTVNPFPAGDIRFQDVAIHPNQSSSIKGSSFSTFQYSQIMAMSLDNHPLEKFFLSTDTKHILIYLGAIPDGEYPIKIKTDLFDITSTHKINVRSLRWNDPINSKLYNGGDLKVSGSFIEGHVYYIRIDDSEDIFVEAKNNQLTIPVPQLNLGAHVLQIGYSTHSKGTYYTDKKVSFEILPPIIDSFSPDIASVGGRIILKGKGLTNVSKIYFGDIDMYAWQKIGDDIEINVISAVQPGIYPIKLVLDGKTITAPGNIEIK